MCTKSQFKRRYFVPATLVSLCVLAVGGYGITRWVAHGVDEWRIRKVSLPKPPDLAYSVSEDQAMELARAALAKAWPEIEQWVPVRDERAQVRFFVRDKSNSGQITFDTDPRAWSATVRLSIEQDTVSCSVVRHK